LSTSRSSEPWRESGLGICDLTVLRRLSIRNVTTKVPGELNIFGRRTAEWVTGGAVGAQTQSFDLRQP